MTEEAPAADHAAGPPRGAEAGLAAGVAPGAEPGLPTIPRPVALGTVLAIKHTVKSNGESNDS